MTRVPLLAREIRSGPRANRSEVDTPKKLIYSSFCGEAVSDTRVTGLLNAVKAAFAFMKPGCDSTCGSFAGLRYRPLWIVLDFGNGLRRQLFDFLLLNCEQPAYGSEGREFESLSVH